MPLSASYPCDNYLVIINLYEYMYDIEKKRILFLLYIPSKSVLDRNVGFDYCCCCIQAVIFYYITIRMIDSCVAMDIFACYLIFAIISWQIVWMFITRCATIWSIFVIVSFALVSFYNLEIVVHILCSYENAMVSLTNPR